MIGLLREIDLFEGVADERLAGFAATGREVWLEPGETMVTAGTPPEEFYVVAEGRIAWSRTVAGQEVLLGTRDAVTYAGAINVLTGESSPATGRADTRTLVVAFPAAGLQALLRVEPALMHRVAALIAPLYQNTEALMRQREKLAALGTLSAGLAHELNNPAAAARRTSAELAEALATLQDTVYHFVSSGVEREEAARLVELQRDALARAADGGPRDLLADSDREDALAAHLDRLGLEGWRLAEPFAEAGLDPAWVDEVAANARTALPDALEWVAASLTARGLVQELHESTERISTIVGAVKDYTYMDRGTVQDVDVHAGIESTLTMLGHKLKRGDVRVERDYDPSLPHISAHGSELNQVWTNLLDNAIDAVDGQGTIRIRTCRAGSELIVDISDDGPGIPPEVAPRVFEPFFTTKDVGQGSGLGLDIARRIVAGHGGDLRLESRPGETRFEVRLPLEPR